MTEAGESKPKAEAFAKELPNARIEGRGRADSQKTG